MTHITIEREEAKRILHVINSGAGELRQLGLRLAGKTLEQALAAPVQELQRYSPNGEGGMEVDSLGAYVKHQDVSNPPAAPVQKRPPNCGTSYCSCIECIMPPAQPAVPLTDEAIERALKAACMHSTPKSRKDMRRAIEAAAQPAVRESVSAKKDAVFAASIEFIGTLTDMKPPPIESAPPEVFKPFRDFTDKVCAIFADQQPEVQQEAVPTVYLYRQPDGSTQVMAPNINDPALVIDILEEGIRAMDEGQPITRN